MSKPKNHFERRKEAEEARKTKATEEVAQEEKAAPVASEELVGDINGDGVVDSADLKLVEEAIDASNDEGEL